MQQALQIIGSITLAAIPALIWGHLFSQKNPEDRRTLGLTFFVGALAVFPILIYKFLWQFFPWMNALSFADRYSGDVISFSDTLVLPLSAIISFMFIGILEESMKLGSVKLVDEDEIKNVDDSIEFFVMAALGFAFTENILYFYNIWITKGMEDLFVTFLYRSAFSTFAHLLFSGILGYYYGMAHFAKPILQEEMMSKRKFVTKLVYKSLTLGRESSFHTQKLLEGLLIASGLHAFFNIFLVMDLKFMIVPFLVCGYVTLNYLFAIKENHKNYGKFLENERNHATAKLPLLKAAE
ncbi:MAG: PrsW family glutamic-type intramembrane protease [Patescibacteria group bacterium]